MYLSIPALPGQRCAAAAFPQSLRVTNCFVAVLAYADKVALPVAICIRVPDIQRKLWRAAHMVDMVHQLRPPVTSALLAQLALMLVHVQHLVRYPHPLRRTVERMHITGCYQSTKPFVKLIGHFLYLSMPLPNHLLKFLF